MQVPDVEDEIADVVSELDEDSEIEEIEIDPRQVPSVDELTGADRECYDLLRQLAAREKAPEF